MLNTNQMDSTTTTNVENNYYGLLSMDDDNDNTDDATIVTSNKSTGNSMRTTHMPTMIDDNSTITQQNPLKIRSTSISLPTKAKAWMRVIHANNLTQLPQAAMALNTKRVTRAVQWAISDSGATGHFMVEGAAVINKQPATKPIQIMMPDGSKLLSTHTCNVDIPWLPNTMTGAHIVPGLSHASLISTRKFCDAGCRVAFDQEECRVYYKNKLVLIGTRDQVSQLWKLPINPSHKPHRDLNSIMAMDIHTMPHQQANHAAYNVYTIQHKQNQLKYMHQAFFNALMPTLLKAVSNGHLEGIPFMKADIIKKYLAKSTATSKGRMKRPRAGIRSTRKKPPTNRHLSARFQHLMCIPMPNAPPPH